MKKPVKPSLAHQRRVNLGAMVLQLEELNKQKGEELIRLRQQIQAALHDKNTAVEEAHSYRRIAEAMAHLLALDLAPSEFLGIFGQACIDLKVDPEETHAKAENVIQCGYVTAVRVLART